LYLDFVKEHNTIRISQKYPAVKTDFFIILDCNIAHPFDMIQAKITIISKCRTGMRHFFNHDIGLLAEGRREACKDNAHRRQCKMFSSKQVHLQRDFAAGVYLSEAQNPLPPITHYIRVYRIITHTGGGGELKQKEG
jgi:hypothetical protein